MRDTISDHYDFEAREEVEIKGKGKMRTWILKGDIAFSELFG